MANAHIQIFVTLFPEKTGALSKGDLRQLSPEARMPSTQLLLSAKHGRFQGGRRSVPAPWESRPPGTGISPGSQRSCLCPGACSAEQCPLFSGSSRTKGAGPTQLVLERRDKQVSKNAAVVTGAVQGAGCRRWAGGWRGLSHRGWRASVQWKAWEGATQAR